jgi:hypothetical protein
MYVSGGWKGVEAAALDIRASVENISWWKMLSMAPNAVGLGSLTIAVDLVVSGWLSFDLEAGFANGDFQAGHFRFYLSVSPFLGVHLLRRGCNSVARWFWVGKRRYLRNK